MSTALEIRQFVIEPVLSNMGRQYVGMHSPRAVALLLMIAAHESGDFRHIRQVTSDGWGPAVGIYQMEYATLLDLWHNYLKRRRGLRRLLERWAMPAFSKDSLPQLYNHFYATAAARLQLWRVPEPLPHRLEELAVYAKRYWNTESGKASVDDYLTAARRHIDAFPRPYNEER